MPGHDLFNLAFEGVYQARIRGFGTWMETSLNRGELGRDPFAIARRAQESL